MPLQIATSDGVGHFVGNGFVCFLNARQEALWIHNVHFVPSATANVLSMSAAIRDGASFQCHPKGACTKMLGPCGWECTIVHDRGLYFLQHVPPTARKVQRGKGERGAQAHVAALRRRPGLALA